VASALDVRRVLIPVAPGVFTAVGMLASDVEHHFVRAAGGLLDDEAALARGQARLDALRAEALATLAAEGYGPAQARLVAQADLRYAGQGSELVVAIPGGRLERGVLDALREAFAREYAATYGYASDEELELVNVRVVATGLRPNRLDFRTIRVAAGAPPPAARRRVSFDRRAGAADTPVLAREAVPAAGTTGPLIVESYDSTVVVPPGAAIRRDALDNLLIILGATS
jgi:N-methylhydantoinase A